jgi:leucine-rich repeat-containing G protein-coupled receptor 6
MLFSNLGANSFSHLPSKGLRNVVHMKTHNNPRLVDFPGPARFPKARSLVLSYAYHCCQFMPSTFENQLVPDYADFGHLQETVYFPGEGNFDHVFWQNNNATLWAGRWQFRRLP